MLQWTDQCNRINIAKKVLLKRIARMFVTSYHRSIYFVISIHRSDAFGRLLRLPVSLKLWQSPKTLLKSDLTCFRIPWVASWDDQSLVLCTHLWIHYESVQCNKYAVFICRSILWFHPPPNVMPSHTHPCCGECKYKILFIVVLVHA